MVPHKSIDAVYIVTDSERPITPGLLCREYMMSYDKSELDPNVFEIHIAGTKNDGCVNVDTILEMTLPQLFPAMSIWAGRRISYVMKLTNDELRIDLTCSDPAFSEMYDVAFERSKQKASEFFALTYTACIQFGDETIDIATQVVAMEYGCSLDAIGMLANSIIKKQGENIQLTKVVMVDSLGVVHAPFAVGRSFLGEHTDNEAVVFYHDEEFKIKTINVLDLVPAPPDFGSDLGK